MVSTIDTAFIEQYNADAHNAYQRDGFMMQRMTRSGTVRGTTVYWQKVAALTAQDKPRNAMHSFTDMTHTRVSATMVDKYVPTLIASSTPLTTCTPWATGQTSRSAMRWKRALTRPTSVAARLSQ